MRCAIYTRRSAEERADGEFGSLDNQRGYCAAYIASQGGQGWQELSERYDDNGYSGGNLNRPALRRLRADIATGRVDTVVVYKIDRLSRSLLDFSNLVAELEARGVTFVSVTQSIDSGTAMGRLTLNVLLSFAQFERELTGERLTEWFAGARAQGLWTRSRPYGYAKEEGSNRLVPHPTEAAVIRWIFRAYIRIKSAERVADMLFQRGVRNTLGRPWTGSMVRHAIRHPVYLGQMVYYRTPQPGCHDPIVSRVSWTRANAILDDLSRQRRARGPSHKTGLLNGLLKDRTGANYVLSCPWAKGKMYRYYIAQEERRARIEPYSRFRADDLEQAVIDAVDRMTGNRIQAEPSRVVQREHIRRYVEAIRVEAPDLIIIFRTGAEVRCPALGLLGARLARPRPTSDSPRKRWQRQHLPERPPVLLIPARDSSR